MTDVINDVDTFLKRAKVAVVHAYNRNSPQADQVELTVDDIYIVWFSKTLKNWKALLSNSVETDMYYEVTYDGDKHTAYVDTYHKIHNTPVFLSDILRDI